MSLPALPPMSEAAFAALRSQPGFRAACENSAAVSLVAFQQLEPAYQWITKDIGRSGICVTALILDFLGQLTVQALTAACVEQRISSPGRVSQLVRRCQQIGQFVVDEGSGLWTRRPAHLGQGLLEVLHGRGLIDLRAAVALAPELVRALAPAQTDEGFRTYIFELARITTQRRDLFAFSKNSPVDYFLQREAGMLILFELLVAQSPQRERFLEEARFSRYALSRRYGVSRSHINKLLAESGHAEAIGDRVIFSPELSDNLERHFAMIFELNLIGARALAARDEGGDAQAQA